MNNKDFNAFLEKTLVRTRNVLASKGNEYASESDRFHNFKRGQAYLNVNNPSTVGWAYLSKHLVSIQDIIEATEKNQAPMLAVIDEKFGDAVNYLILLWGMYYEETFNES
jgi:hypothetical protein